MEYIKIVVKSGKDAALRRFHPWVFSGAIKKIYGGEPKEGDIVAVYDNKDEFLGLGHYQIGSIAIRVFSFQDVEINRDFWIGKFKKAFDYRKQMNILDNKDTNVYRLIHAEGDGMPGLIIDYYNGTAVIQTHSIGMHLLKDLFTEILQELLGDTITAVYYKSESTLPHKADIEPKNEYLLENDSISNVVKEYGNRFNIDWINGQKTGFFIDQRENRRLLGEYSKDKKVCNVFGYTGGFSVYALKAGAELVHSVDSSKLAIDLTNENIELNFGKDANHKGFAMDAFDFFDTTNEEYDIIILDPPAFAKHQKVLHNALQGYKRINQRALEQIKSGGIIFTFSCSQAVSKENFRKSVFAAAANARRNVKILHQLTQPIDHPISIYHPESEYLKGLVLYVE
jgi:23S rRNA (cytosine1962-C5)-methyltransferase